VVPLSPKYCAAAWNATAVRTIHEPELRTAVTGIPNPNAAQQNERADGGTGLYYYRARYYDPVRSRFVQKDPLGLAGGIDFYAYIMGDVVDSME